MGIHENYGNQGGNSLFFFSLSSSLLVSRSQEGARPRVACLAESKREPVRAPPLLLFPNVHETQVRAQLCIILISARECMAVHSHIREMQAGKSMYARVSPYILSACLGGQAEALCQGGG